MRRWLPYIIVPTLSIIIGLVLSEILIRLLVDKHKWQYWNTGHDFRFDADIGFTHIPNLDSLVAGPDGGPAVRFRTNMDGILPAQASPTKKRLRVMIFGDSTGLGRLAPEGERVHDWLTAKFRRQGLDVEVLNASVQAYSTAQSVLLMERLLPKYQPDLVLHIVCANDFTDNLVEGFYSLPRNGYRLAADGTLKRQFSRVPSASFQQDVSGIRRWIRESAIYRIFVRTRDGMRKSGPSEYVFNPLVIGESLPEVQQSLFEALLRRMRDLVSRSGAQLMVYSHPSVEVWPETAKRILEEFPQYQDRFDAAGQEKYLAGLTDRLGISFCPLVPYLRENLGRGPFHFVKDAHCNSRGYELTAERLEQCASENHLLTSGK